MPKLDFTKKFNGHYSRSRCSNCVRGDAPVLSPRRTGATMSLNSKTAPQNGGRKVSILVPLVRPRSGHGGQGQRNARAIRFASDLDKMTSQFASGDRNWRNTALQISAGIQHIGPPISDAMPAPDEDSTGSWTSFQDASASLLLRVRRSFRVRILLLGRARRRF